ncbi:MAG: hypothetical protein QXO94_05450 [Candidatus Bathyarchaeia archaeon]
MDARAFSKENPKLVTLLKTLADEDSLRILLEANKGLPSGLQGPKLLGMTKRRYYIRINELLKAGLLKKTESFYKLTVIGKVVMNSLYEELLRLIPHAKILEQLSELGLMSKENIATLMPELSSSEILSIRNLLEARIRFEVITTYDELITKICDGVDDAKRSILLVSKYMDFSFAKHLLGIQERDVKVFVITDFNMQDVIVFAKNFIRHFQVLIPVIKFLKSDKILFRRIGGIPISFMVVDENICIFELPSISKDFEIALLTDHKQIVEKMTNIFWKIWGRSEPTNLKGYLEEDIELE